MSIGRLDVLALIVVFGVVASVAWLVVANRRRRRLVASTIVRLDVDGAAPVLLGELEVALVGRRDLLLRHDSADTLVLERRVIPGWAIFVAVVGFPVGLVALLCRDTHTAMVRARPAGVGRCEVVVSGSLDRRSAQAVNGVLDAHGVRAVERTRSGVTVS